MHAINVKFVKKIPDFIAKTGNAKNLLANYKIESEKKVKIKTETS